MQKVSNKEVPALAWAVQYILYERVVARQLILGGVGFLHRSKVTLQKKVCMHRSSEMNQNQSLTKGSGLGLLLYIFWGVSITAPIRNTFQWTLGYSKYNQQNIQIYYLTYVLHTTPNNPVVLYQNHYRTRPEHGPSWHPVDDGACNLMKHPADPRGFCTTTWFKVLGGIHSLLVISCSL